MKRIVSIILILMLLPCLFIQTLAAENTSPNLIQTSENGTTYSLTSLDNGGIMKSYQKAGQTNLSTTAVLSDLGMGDEFIDQLSPETIQIYENAESITSITTYSKTSADGSTTYLSRGEALSEIASTRAVVLPPVDDGGGEIIEAPPYDDDYMRITFTIAKMGNGYYYMSTDAVWLTMPAYRRSDSIGICAEDCTVVNNTRQGWYRYNTTRMVDNQIVQTPSTIYFDSTHINNAVSTDWAGTGAIFDLPVDIEQMRYHSDLMAHFEAQLVLKTPAQEHYFNATATYVHLRLGIAFSPLTLAIATTGPSASIGIDVIDFKDTRVVELPTPIHYVP